MQLKLEFWKSCYSQAWLLNVNCARFKSGPTYLITTTKLINTHIHNCSTRQSFPTHRPFWYLYPRYKRFVHSHNCFEKWWSTDIFDSTDRRYLLPSGSSNYCTTCHWLQLAGEFYLSLSAPIYRSNEFTDPTAPGLQGGRGVVYTRHITSTQSSFHLLRPTRVSTLQPPCRAFRKGEKLPLQIICIFVSG